MAYMNIAEVIIAHQASVPLLDLLLCICDFLLIHTIVNNNTVVAIRRNTIPPTAPPTVTPMADESSTITGYQLYVNTYMFIH